MPNWSDQKYGIGTNGGAVGPAGQQAPRRGHTRLGCDLPVLDPDLLLAAPLVPPRPARDVTGRHDPVSRKQPGVAHDAVVDCQARTLQPPRLGCHADADHDDVRGHASRPPSSTTSAGAAPEGASPASDRGSPLRIAATDTPRRSVDAVGRCSERTMLAQHRPEHGAQWDVERLEHGDAAPEVRHRSRPPLRR